MNTGPLPTSQRPATGPLPHGAPLGVPTALWQLVVGVCVAVAALVGGVVGYGLLAWWGWVG